MLDPLLFFLALQFPPSLFILDSPLFAVISVHKIYKKKPLTSHKITPKKLKKFSTMQQ